MMNHDSNRSFRRNFMENARVLRGIKAEKAKKIYDKFYRDDFKGALYRLSKYVKHPINSVECLSDPFPENDFMQNFFNKTYGKLFR